ncbi:ABC transporter permease [Blastococcus sp. SYSU D00820]
MTARADAPATARPGPIALLGGQVRYAVLDLWRTGVVLVFSFALPLVWLLVIGAVAGNETVDEAGGVRVMQFATPTAIAMGVLYSAYPTVAISLAAAREAGVLKRLRGTPLPAWAYLAGRIGGAVVFALASVAAALAVGVVGFDVRILDRTLPATVATLVLGIACFAAIGLAVAAVSRTQAVAQAASVATAVTLTFVSGMFTLDSATPRWLDVIGEVFPLKPFTAMLQEQFDPFGSGSGWHWGRAAVVAGWGLLAGVVAARWFGWEPGRRGGGAAPPAGAPARATGNAPAGAVRSGRPSSLAMVLDQARAADRAARRDAASLFFALVMPVGLYAFFVGTQGRGGEVGGMPFETFFAAGMVAWGAGVTVVINLPESVALARDKGVLKRLRGTPLRPWQYLAGRTAAGLWMAVLIAVLVLGVAVLAFDVRLPAGAVLLGLPIVLLGTLTLTACGFALASFVPTAKAVGPVALVVLLPLAFFSDVFLVGGPEWMRTIGGLFPLRHFQSALAQAWHVTPSIGWDHVAVLAGWGAVAAVVAVRWFRWEPRGGQ